MAENILRFRSDFDGVFNNPEVGADAFSQMYRGIVAAQLGLRTTVVNSVFRDARQIIQADPEKFGWIINGQLVCPWYADHYQETKAIADVGLNILRTNHIPTLNHLPTKEETPDFLNNVFQIVHPHIIAPPKPDARDAIEELVKVSDFGLVSNSETVNVRKGLVVIYKGDEAKAGRIHVTGDAKKQKIDPEFTWVKETQKVPGLKRRPHLRRKQFIETLLKEQAHGFAEDTADFLYAPVAIGLFGILLKTPRTRPYELAFFRKNGAVANNLEELVAHVKEQAYNHKHK